MESILVLVKIVIILRFLVKAKTAACSQNKVCDSKVQLVEGRLATFNLSGDVLPSHFEAGKKISSIGPLYTV